MNEGDFAAVSRAYDSVGAELDAIVQRNPINAWMREASREVICRVIRPGATLLEIGCGTGADAIFFASKGHRVVAMDISPRMVELSRANVRAAGFEGKVVVHEGRLHDLSPSLAGGPDCPFGGAYANFSLTYEQPVREVGDLLYPLLAPGSPFLFTLPNKLCFSEPLLFLGTLRPGRMLSRFEEPRWGTIRGESILARAYSPSEVQVSLRGKFRVRGLRGVPVFLPPPNWYTARFGWMVRAGKSLDRALSGHRPWNRLGDTTLFWSEREGQ